MILKILFLFFTLILIIFGIIEAVQLDDYLEDYYEEPAMLITGGLVYIISWIFVLVNTIAMLKGADCGCTNIENHGVAVIHAVNVMLIGAFLFAEPFVRYLVDTIQGIDR